MSAQKDVVINTGSSGLIGLAVTKRFVEYFDELVRQVVRRTHKRAHEHPGSYAPS
jgi:NAD(P)-dependent dehydrogenase (short-subunit alcohol dehydrogenase family)